MAFLTGSSIVAIITQFKLNGMELMFFYATYGMAAFARVEGTMATLFLYSPFVIYLVCRSLRLRPIYLFR